MELMEKGRIATGDDLRSLVSLLPDPDMLPVVRVMLSRTSTPASVDVRAAAVDLVGKVKDTSDERQQLGAFLRFCTAHDIKEAIPAIRSRIKKARRYRFGKERPGDVVFTFVHKHDPRAGRIFDVMRCGHALAELGSIEDVDLLFERDEVLCMGNAGKLAALGLPALRKAVEIARRERGPRADAAEMVIRECTDPSEFPVLRELLHDPIPEIRRAAVVALATGKDPELERTLGELKGESDRGVVHLAHMYAWHADPLLHKNEILKSLWGDDKGPMGVLYVLELLSDPEVAEKIPGIDAELERFIRAHEQQYPAVDYIRYHAALALWRLTERKVPYKKWPESVYPWESRYFKSDPTYGPSKRKPTK